MQASLQEIIVESGYQIVDRLLPSIVIIPDDINSIANLVKLATEKRFRILPTGTGSSFAADYSPPDNTVFLMMTTLSQVLDLKLLDAIVVVESGMLFSTLAERLVGTDLELPEFLVKYPGTIGGAILSPDSTGFRHSELRRRILGVQMINANGDILSFGGASIKNVAGYEYWSYLIGTGGRFGIITHAIINIDKMPILDFSNNMEKPSGVDESPAQWIYANLCKGLDPGGIFAR